MNDLFTIISEKKLCIISFKQEQFSFVFKNDGFYLYSDINGKRTRCPITLEQLQKIYSNASVKSKIMEEFTKIQDAKIDFSKAKDNIYKLVTSMLQINDPNFTKIARVIDIISGGYTYHLDEAMKLRLSDKTKWDNVDTKNLRMQVVINQVDQSGNNIHSYPEYSQDEIIKLIWDKISINPEKFESGLIVMESNVEKYESVKKESFNAMTNYSDVVKVNENDLQNQSNKKRNWLESLKNSITSKKQDTSGNIKTSLEGVESLLSKPSEIENIVR